MQTTTVRRPRERRYIVVLVTAICITMLTAFASPAYAEEVAGEVTLGVESLNTDNRSSKLGEYTGHDDDATIVDADIDMTYTAEDWYLELMGERLGWDNRTIDLEASKYNGWKLHLGLDQNPHIFSSSAETIYDGVGSDRLTLPAGFTPGDKTTDIAADLAAYKKPIELRVDRTRSSADFSVPFGPLTLAVGFTQDKRTGEQALIGSLGLTGGVNRAMDLPIPIDYTTNDFSAALHYKAEHGYAQLIYETSSFSNANRSVMWDSPFDTTWASNNQPATTSFPATGQTSLAPDNTYQRIGLSGGLHGLPMRTVVRANIDMATSKQDETLLPYSINSASTITHDLPRSSAQAEIAQTSYNLAVSSRPVDRLEIKLDYKYLKRDNKTPRDLFIYVPMDSGVAQDGENGGHALYNMPSDTTETEMGLEVAWKIVSGASVFAAYQQTTEELTYREVDKTTDKGFTVGASSMFEKGIARIKYGQSDRKYDGVYSEEAVFRAYHSQEHVDEEYAAHPTTTWDNHPLFRRWDIANRKRTEVVGSVTYLPVETVNMGLYVTSSNDDYYDTVLGLTKSEYQSVTVDVGVTPTEWSNLFVFYTSQNIKADQTSRYVQGFAVASQQNDETRNWSASHEQKIPTFGFGFNLALLDDELMIDGNYSISDSTTSIGMTSGSALELAALPDLKTDLTTADVTGRYKVSDRITVGAGYYYEKYAEDNWALDGVVASSDTLAEVIALYPAVADYTAHAGKVFLTWKFGK